MKNKTITVSYSNDIEKAYKNAKKTTVIKIAVTTIMISIILTASLIVVFAYGKNAMKTAVKNAELKEMRSSATVSVVETTQAEETEIITKTDYSALIEGNNEFAGWINVGDIDQCVMQSEDNKKYLETDYNGDWSYHGEVFMDFRCEKELGSLTILYGHNMQDGVGFANLEKFEDVDYASSNSVITFNTTERDYKFVVYGCFYAAVNNEKEAFNYNASTELTEELVNGIKDRCLYTADGEEITVNDNILLLSTCTRNFDVYEKGVRTYKPDTRVVVVAKMVPLNSEIEVNYSVNSDVVMPQF